MVLYEVSVKCSESPLPVEDGLNPFGITSSPGILCFYTLSTRVGTPAHCSGTK